MVIQLPQKVKYIIDTLINSGYEAYAVGGCVRDCVLGRVPQDWDITTSAKPKEVKTLFPKTIDTGIQHGTVTAIIGREGFEITTYRIDGEYEDMRHPKEVVFTGSLIEDLKRRDFTINAMAYNERDGLVDAFCGMEDIRSRVIRCVGSPKDRFTEDALRMMRAVRFGAQLGFSIEEQTKQAMVPLSDRLSKVSQERIQVELVKLLVSDHPEKFAELYGTGLSRVFLPEFDAMMKTDQNNRHHCYNVGEHTLKAVQSIRADKVLRIVMLLHDVAKPLCKTVDEKGIYHFYGHPQKGAKMAEQILRRLKFDNETIIKSSMLIYWHDDTPPLKPEIVRRIISKIGTENMQALFEVKRADVLAKSSFKREDKLSYIDCFEQLYEDILQKKECLSLKELAVSGKDLIELGMKPGVEIGKTLQELLDHVLVYPMDNERSILLQRTKIQ